MIGSLATPDTTLAIMNASQQSEEIQKNAKTLEEFDKTAKEFEAMFVAEMMKPMFDGLETDGAFGGGKGEEIFRGFLIEEYGALIADSGAIGILTLLY